MDIITKDEDWAAKMERDLSKVCRLCLRGGEVMYPIFEPQLATTLKSINGVVFDDFVQLNNALSTRIMACAQVKVFEGDGLPTHICISCLTQVDKYYQFRQLCERSDSTLRGNLKGFMATSETDSDSEICDIWDMTKFTPEVILDEDDSGQSITSINSNDSKPENCKNQENDNQIIKTFENDKKNSRPSISLPQPSIVVHSSVLDHLYQMSSPINDNNFNKNLYNNLTDNKKFDNNIIINDNKTCLNGNVISAKQLNGQIVSNKGTTTLVLTSPQNRLNGQYKLVALTTDPKEVLKSQTIENNSKTSRRCRNGEKAFKCRQCNKSYSFSSALSRHKAVHNTQLRPHICNVCQRSFTTYEKLLKHQKTHSSDVVWSCDRCTRPFKSFSSLQKHRYLCSNNSTPNNSVLVNDEDKCINDNSAHISISKNDNFFENNDLESKEIISNGEEVVKNTIFQRNDCDNSDILEKDINLDKDEQNKKDTEKETDTDLPIISKSGKGKPEFRCPVCQKCFATRGSLEVHSTIHTGLRPFVCSVCQQAFRHKVNLLEHFQRKHSQVRPYICDVCAARFVTKQELLRHYKKHIGD